MVVITVPLTNWGPPVTTGSYLNLAKPETYVKLYVLPAIVIIAFPGCWIVASFVEFTFLIFTNKFTLSQLAVGFEQSLS